MKNHTNYFLASLFFLVSCYPEMGKINLNPQTSWILAGRLLKQSNAKEIIAIGVDGTLYRTEPNEQGYFGLELPGNNTYAIHFITPIVAILKYEDSKNIGMRDTLRLPPTTNHGSWLNLGQIDIKEEDAFPTINPAIYLDFDKDGQSDFTDIDDQNDGLDDRYQRAETEQVIVCHYEDDDQNVGRSTKIFLSSLYIHLKHGDQMGICKPQ